MTTPVSDFANSPSTSLRSSEDQRRNLVDKLNRVWQLSAGFYDELELLVDRFLRKYE